MSKTKRARVLVADDDPSIVRLLQVNFGLEGFEVQSATHGEDVLPRAKAFSPEVIILDLMMPGIDGWEVCRRLQQDEDTAGIPVIFLSARAQDEDRKRSRELGAEYVAKPFDPNALIDLVRRSVRTSRA
ncbi:MAG: response regulator transcription factor [Actinomycetota bacterium]